MSKSKVFFSISNLKIVSAKHALTEAGIESFTLNKMDSMHPGVFDGKIELYVSEEDEAQAFKILKEEGFIDDL